MGRAKNIEKMGGTGRIPPHSEEAERGVLGSAILDPERVMDICIEHGISTKSFYDDNHGILSEALEKMHHKRKPIDLLTLGDHLKASGKLDRIGGRAFLENLVISVPTAAHAEYYIELVHGEHLLRSIIHQSQIAIKACYDAKYDPRKILSETEESFFRISDNQRKSMKAWAALMDTVVEEVNLVADGRMENPGIYTGFADLDNLLRGMQPADMIVIAARPSMGKTALALNIAEKVLLGVGSTQPPKAVAMFSLEMPAAAIIKRMLCTRAQVNLQTLRGGVLSGGQHKALLDAASLLKNTPFHIDDTGGLAVSEIRARARRLKRRHNIELIIIDYLQLVRDPSMFSDGKQYEVSSISNTLKTMAKELNIPVIVLSQLNRAVEKRDKRKPRLADLRDSGSIEQDADVVGLLRRPCMIDGDIDAHDESLAILDIAKHRNGPTAEVRLNFIKEHTRFEDRTEDE